MTLLVIVILYNVKYQLKGILTRLAPLVEQTLLILPEHLSSPPVFSGVCVTRSLVLCVCFVDRCLSFCPFCFGHCVQIVLLRFTDSDYPFGIFQLFCKYTAYSQSWSTRLYITLVQIRYNIQFRRESFNLTFSYIHDLLSNNNILLLTRFHVYTPNELEINETAETDSYAAWYVTSN